jgi:alkylation response protein AidB-like acyl-CoA dehydrogenase
MMLSDTQVAIRDAVRVFAQHEIRPRAAEFEAAAAYPRSLFRELAGLGLMGMTAPEKWGGAGADYVSYALALMEVAAADGALSTILSIQNSILVSGLLRDGTEAQKTRFLFGLTSGDLIGAFALTEPDAGSDAAAIRTLATRVAGGWRINGTKQFITSGQLADVAMVIAVSDPGAGKRGMSAFLIPTSSPGYIVEKIERKMGQRASDTCALRFDDVFVEDALVFGRLGAGYSLALSNLEAGRIGIAAQAVGMAQAALEIAIGFAKSRRSMGKTIMEHQAVGFRLADSAARLEAARQLVLHAASLKDHGQPCVIEASMAKLVASETADVVCSAALQTLGGYGYVEDFGVEKICRDVRVCQVYEGTSDIRRLVISRAL